MAFFGCDGVPLLETKKDIKVGEASVLKRRRETVFESDRELNVENAKSED